MGMGTGFTGTEVHFLSPCRPLQQTPHSSLAVVKWLLLGLLFINPQPCIPWMYSHSLSLAKSFNLARRNASNYAPHPTKPGSAPGIGYDKKHRLPCTTESSRRQATGRQQTHHTTPTNARHTDALTYLRERTITRNYYTPQYTPNQ